MSNLGDTSKKTAEEVALGALKSIEVAGKVTKEVAESTGDIVISTTRISKDAAKIAEGISGAAANNVGDITDTTFKTTNTAVGALGNVVNTAKEITQTANLLAQRMSDELDQANKRRKEINDQKLTKLKTIREKEAALGVEKMNTEIKQEEKVFKEKQQQLDNEFIKNTKANELELLIIEEKAAKLKADFEIAQLNANANRGDLRTNTYIGTKNFGCKDTECKKMGYKQGLLKNYFYMIESLIHPDNGNVLELKFNEEPGKDGYYTIKDGYVYKLKINPKIKTRNSYIYNTQIQKSLPSYGTIEPVNYVPKCYEGITVPSGTPPVDTTQYILSTTLKVFNGGKTNKKHKSMKYKTRKGNKKLCKTRKSRK
jgi:hypothetical protein